jgi:hypothetical protein
LLPALSFLLSLLLKLGFLGLGLGSSCRFLLTLEGRQGKGIGRRFCLLHIHDPFLIGPADVIEFGDSFWQDSFVIPTLFATFLVHASNLALKGAARNDMICHHKIRFEIFLWLGHATCQFGQLGMHMKIEDLDAILDFFQLLEKVCA